MIQFLVALSLLIHPFSIPQIIPPEDVIEVREAQADYVFGEEITIQATIISADPITEVAVFIQADGKDPLTEVVPINSEGRIQYRLDLRQHYLDPFTRVYYWFHARLSNGSDGTSGSYWFDYQDNRFTWQNLDDGLFQVYWYDGGTEFGQEALNVARRGLESIQELIPLAAPESLDIYLYSTPTDLQQAIETSGRTWISGVANPDLGAVYVSVAPGAEQSQDLERQIPHELTHVLLFQSTGPGYSRLPYWLVEGMASLSELYPNAEYERSIQSAVKQGNLLSMETLCSTLPQDPDNHYLAYAQSADFTRYLRMQYGISGIQSLVQNYANGLGCAEGIEKTFAVPLDQLERQWHEEIGATSRWAGIEKLASSLQGILPYLFLLGLVLAAPLLSLIFVHREREKKLPDQKGEK